MGRGIQMKLYYSLLSVCAIFLSSCNLTPTDVRSTPAISNSASVVASANVDPLQQNVQQCTSAGMQASTSYYFPLANCESAVGVGGCQQVVVSVAGNYLVCYRAGTTTGTGTGTGSGSGSGSASATGTASATTSINPSSVNFSLSGTSGLAATYIGNTGAVYHFTVQNLANITIPSCSLPTITGGNASEFYLMSDSTSNCNAPIGIGASCSNIKVFATPQTVGTKSTTLSINCQGVIHTETISYNAITVSTGTGTGTGTGTNTSTNTGGGGGDGAGSNAGGATGS